VLAGVLCGFGWTYILDGLGWLAVGPRVGDALPLLQLAGRDGQPLVRMLVAWLLAGAATGVALQRLSPLRRAVIAAALGIPALLLASQAADALTRNLRFGTVLVHRAPGVGPWLEGLILALGCALSGSVARRRRRGGWAVSPSSRAWLGHLGLGGGERRDAAEH
jgi:hypothetical protein